MSGIRRIPGEQAGVFSGDFEMDEQYEHVKILFMQRSTCSLQVLCLCFILNTYLVLFFQGYNDRMG